MAAHGKAATYRGPAACRCAACAEAHRLRSIATRARYRECVEAGDPAVPHGTRSGYSNWGCRCLACYETWRESIGLSRARGKLRDGRPLNERDTELLARAGHDLAGLAP